MDGRQACDLFEGARPYLCHSAIAPRGGDLFDVLELPVVRPWKLAEVNYAYIKEHPYEVAVLPCGATEPHNLHLPYCTDVFEGETVGEKICEAAHQQGANVVLLPTIPYGTETNQMAFPMAMNLNPSTLFAVITDLVKSARASRDSQDRAAQQPRRQ